MRRTLISMEKGLIVNTPLTLTEKLNRLAIESNSSACNVIDETLHYIRKVENDVKYWKTKSIQNNAVKSLSEIEQAIIDLLRIWEAMLNQKLNDNTELLKTMEKCLKK